MIERKWSTRFITLVAVLVCSFNLSAWGKKPGGGNGGGSSATVQYRLAYLDVPETWGTGWETQARDMNDLGTIVGTATDVLTGQMRAVAWFPSTAMIDLNVGAFWTPAEGTPVSGWTATNALSVNSSNQIIGRAEKTGETARAFVYDMATLSFVLLPTVVGQTTVGGHGDINDDAAVAFQIGFGVDGWPWGTVVCAPPLYQPQLLPASIGGFWIRINNLGTLCDQSGFVVYPVAGTYDYTQAHVTDLGSAGYRFWGLGDNVDTVTGRFLGSGKIKAGPVRLDLGSNSRLLLASTAGNAAHDINDQNDFIVWGSSIGRDTVYKNGEGLLSLDNLVVNKDSGWQQAYDVVLIALTNSSVTTDPNATGHGAICGTRWAASSSGKRAFVLFAEDQP